MPSVAKSHNFGVGKCAGKAPRKSHNNNARRVPPELQQALLNIFANAFPTQNNSDSASAIQQIKQHLFNREFSQAFGSERLLEAYALRWSPTRALAYLDIFRESPHVSTALLSSSSCSKEYDTKTDQSACRQVVCLGGGSGSELIALAALLHMDERNRASVHPTSLTPTEYPALKLGCTIVDIADWSKVIRCLYFSTTEAPSVSQFTSPETTKAVNKPFVDASKLQVDFFQQDVLNMEVSTKIAESFHDATLVTLMFTLNELYNTSNKATTNLLLLLTMLMQPGALLLVVDSPGSYSTVGLGKSSPNGESGKHDQIKKYPMQWLLDHTLLEAASIGSSKNASSGKEWERLESQDSRWFRLAEVRYPIDLQDMRYQVHLYRKLNTH